MLQSFVGDVLTALTSERLETFSLIHDLCVSSDGGGEKVYVPRVQDEMVYEYKIITQ